MRRFGLERLSRYDLLNVRQLVTCSLLTDIRLAETPSVPALLDPVVYWKHHVPVPGTECHEG